MGMWMWMDRSSGQAAERCYRLDPQQQKNNKKSCCGSLVCGLHNDVRVSVQFESNDWRWRWR